MEEAIWQPFLPIAALAAPIRVVLPNMQVHDGKPALDVALDPFSFAVDCSACPDE